MCDVLCGCIEVFYFLNLCVLKSAYLPQHKEVRTVFVELVFSFHFYVVYEDKTQVINRHFSC